MESLIELTKKYGPERDAIVDTLKARNGFIKPVKVFAATMGAIDMIVLRRKSLKYVKVVLDNNRGLNSQERKRVIELIRSAFPKDYFKDRAKKAFVKKNPGLTKRMRDDRQLTIEYKKIADSA